jgi:uroporphyrinogen-III synthase
LKKSISILSIGEPGEEARKLASERGVEMDVVPFTEMRFLDNEELRQRLEQLSAEQVVGAVTSRNGLKALLQLLPEVECKWKIFCLGNYKEEIENQQFNLKNVELIWVGVSGAAELAEELIRANVKKVVFFCGNQRMDILPETLAKAGIDIEELVVYDTVSLSYKVTKSYNGILFYSPSMVAAFFECNELERGCKAFAIGNSTAAALKNRGVENVYIPDRPSKLALVGQTIELLCK